MQVKFTCIFKCIIHKEYNVICNYTDITGVNSKMFEIKKPSASNKTIRMPDELIDRLEKLAAQNDISFNQLVIQCCEYALKDLKLDKKSDQKG